MCVCVRDWWRLTSRLCSPAVLERKMSTRQSREELIKKGVLKEVYEKGERTKVEVRVRILLADLPESNLFLSLPCPAVVLRPCRWRSAGGPGGHKDGERAFSGSGLQPAGAGRC